MVILGIDPGTTRMGYALLKDAERGPVFIKAGLIGVSSSVAEERLKEIHQGINNLINTWHPSCLAMERLFFLNNQKTAFAVAEARGVALLTTSLAGVKVFEYTPLEVKKIVTGDGRADKTQVKKMVKMIFPETAKLAASDDVFDAIAVALTCYYNDRKRV